MAGRRGPPVSQLYRDLARLGRKGVVLSTGASPAHITGAAVAWVATLGAALLLPLGPTARPDVRDELGVPRLARAIGVIYRPATELQSHHFPAVLPLPCDEYAWLDRRLAVSARAAAHGMLGP